MVVERAVERTVGSGSARRGRRSGVKGLRGGRGESGEVVEGVRIERRKSNACGRLSKKTESQFAKGQVCKNLWLNAPVPSLLDSCYETHSP